MQSLEYKEGLTRGLVRSDDNPRNAQGFITLRGCKANEYGFVAYDTIVNPLAAWMVTEGLSVSWPFPQFYRGKQLSLMMTETAVYIINETAWTGAAPASTYDFFTGEAGYTITAGGGAWHVIDLGSPIILINETHVLYVTATTMWGTIHGGFQCGAEHHGRVFVSGFESDPYSAAQWQAIADLINTLDTTTPLTLPQTSVFWSAYGGMDILFLLVPYLAIYVPLTITQLVTQGNFSVSPTAWTLSAPAMWDAVNLELDFTSVDTAQQTLATSESGKRYCVGYYIKNYASGSVTASLGGTALTARSADGYYWEEVTCPSDGATLLFAGSAGAALSVDNVRVFDVDDSEYGLTRPFYLEHMHRGDMGILPTPWQGTQRVIKPLGGNAIIYSDNGAGELVPFDSESGPTVGFHRVPDIPGIHGRAAVAGDDTVHLMVDPTGCVWRLRPGQKPERLDYEWLLSSMTDIVVTFDSTREEFYIGGTIGGTLYSYLFTASGGMSRVPQGVVSLECGGGTLYGIVSADLFTGFEAVTLPFDLGVRGIKTVREIQVGAIDVTTLQTNVDYKHSGPTTTFIRSPAIQCSPEGTSYPVFSGTDFRARLTGTFGAAGKLDYLKIGATLDDKRSSGNN